MLLRRCAACDTASCAALPGTKLFLALEVCRLCEDELRLTVDAPRSAKLPPEEVLWNTGCAGRGGASDAREPDIDRAWLAVYGATWLMPEIEFERFSADAGCGMPVLL